MAATVTLSMMLTAAPFAVLAEEPTGKAVVVAQPTQTQAEWAKVVRERLALGTTYKLTTVSEGTNLQGVNTYSFSFVRDELAVKSDLRVTLDPATGDIEDITSYGTGDPLKGATLTDAEAIAVAKDAIKTYTPSLAGQIDNMLVYVAETNGENYFIQALRTKNGIPVYGDAINVVVHKDKRVTQYTKRWEAPDNLLEQTTPALTLEQAKAAYQKLLPLSLRYTTRTQPGSQSVQVLLTYTPNQSADMYYNEGELPLVDAMTGQITDKNGNPLAPVGPLKPIADKQGAPLVATAGLLEREAALVLAKQHASVSGDVKMENSEFTNGQDGAIWTFSFSVLQDGKKYQYRVSLDAMNGELREYWRYRGDYAPLDGPKEKQLSFESQKAKAIEAVQRTVPTKADELVLLTTSAHPNMGSKFGGAQFSFGRLVNGLLSGVGVSVSVDPLTGELTELHTGLDRGYKGQPLTYPDPAQAISQAAAREKYAAAVTLSLQYVPVYELAADRSRKIAKYRLAYVPTNFDRTKLLNALTGTFFSVYGGDKPESKKVSDIAGHWAEQQLQYMADYEIYPLDGDTIKPNQIVSRGDVIRTLVLTLAQGQFANKDEKSSSSYHDVPTNNTNYQYIETAVAMGWLPRDLKEFRPEEPMKREELAQLVVKALGYGRLAEQTDAFVLPFADLKQEDQAYVGPIAVAKALGLMRGNGQTFGPDHHVSRAELAVVFLKAQEERGKR